MDGEWAGQGPDSSREDAGYETLGTRFFRILSIRFLSYRRGSAVWKVGKSLVYLVERSFLNVC